MPSPQIIGKRGENLFRVMITQWCGGDQWFEEVFEGATAEGLDFIVYLLEPTVFKASFYVQVKATVSKHRYEGAGTNRRIRIRLRKKDAQKLGNMGVPAYVVGVDVHSGRGYIRAVHPGAKSGFASISTRFRLNCRAIRKLWHEVEDFWNSRPNALTGSAFEE